MGLESSNPSFATWKLWDSEQEKSAVEILQQSHCPLQEQGDGLVLQDCCKGDRKNPGDLLGVPGSHWVLGTV